MGAWRRKPFAKAPPCRRREEINAIVSAGNPSGSFHSPPPFAQGRLSPLGDYKLSPAGQACSPSLAKGSAPPPGDHQLDLKSLCLLLFLSHQVCMDREKTVRLFSLCFGAGRRNSPGSERSICQTMEKVAKARPFPANAFAGQARSGRYNGE